MRAVFIALVTGAVTLAGMSAVMAQGEPTTAPTADGGNGVINGGAGSGTGTASPGPGMTLKEGSNPTPTASPTGNGGNTATNGGAGAGTGTKEPKGDR